jgi:ribosomal protein L37AE/L43A
MLNQFKYKCPNCDKEMDKHSPASVWFGKIVCQLCYDRLNYQAEHRNDESTIHPDELRKMVNEVFNTPSHYHTHDIDTIEFLKRGFPPQVLTGFLIGNIIKYTQRFEYKNGEDDVLKIVDYAKRLEEWYKETHS